MNWYAITTKTDEPAEVTLYDEIGAWGISAKEFIKDLAGIKGHINLRLNSPGGSITDGTAIISALKRHQGGFTAWVDGLAASMASVIACAADRCYMAEGAMMMVHRASTISMGDAADLRKDADLLEKFEKSLVNVYAKKTGMSEPEINAMLEAETWLNPLEAIALGFCDGISETPAAVAVLSPAQMRGRFDTFRNGMVTKPITAVEPDPAVEPIAPVEPAPVVEPVVDPVVDPVVEPVAPVEPAIVAALSVDAMVAKISDMTNRISILTAELDKEKTDRMRLERSFGVAVASILPVVNASETATQSLTEQFNAINDPEKKSEFYRKNAAALKQELKN